MKTKPGTAKLRGSEVQVNVSRVFENSWNYNKQDDWMFDKQKHSLERFAQSAPIIVREIFSESSEEGESTSSSFSGEESSSFSGEERMFEIIDGAHRYRAAKELGWDEVSVWNLGNISDTEARELTIIFNEVKGRPHVDSLSELLAVLEEDIGRDQLVEDMPFTKQQIDDMIDTLNFDWANFEAEDDEEEDEEPNHMVRVEFRMSEKEAEMLDYGMKTYGITNNVDYNTVEGKTQVLLGMVHEYMQQTAGNE